MHLESGKPISLSCLQELASSSMRLARQESSWTSFFSPSSCGQGTQFSSPVAPRLDGRDVRACARASDSRCSSLIKFPTLRLGFNSPSSLVFSSLDVSLESFSRSVCRRSEEREREVLEGDCELVEAVVGGG